MNKKILSLLTAVSFAFFMSACGDDNSSSAGVDCLDNEECLVDDIDSSDSEDDASSSSAKSSKDKSSSSVKKDSKSSSSAKEAKSSSSAKKDEKSSSSTKGSKSSSSSKKDEKSSSSEKVESSSSEAEPESSSSVELKITYLSETPNAADLEVSGDTLFAVFQRSVSATTVEFPEPGLLAMFKLSDGTLLDTITLATKNPQFVKMIKGSLYVGTTGGSYNASWGTDADEERGIEKVDLKKKKSELWVSGTQLGAGVYMMEADAKNGKIYVALNKGYDADFNADMPVVEVDVATKTVKNIDGIYDGSGSFFFDNKTGLLYIGDRGNMTELDGFMAYSYDGKKLSPLYDDETHFGYQPAGIAVAGGEVFVYITDYYVAGRLYWIENDDLSENNLEFSTDTKIVMANDVIYVLDRKGSGSISQVNPSTKTVAWQKAINAENPYDIVAIDGSAAWVAMYNTAEIRKISLADGSTISSIDTKAFSAKEVEEVTDAE